MDGEEIEGKKAGTLDPAKIEGSNVRGDLRDREDGLYRQHIATFGPFSVHLFKELNNDHSPIRGLSE